MTDNIAILDGYTKEIYGEYKGEQLDLLVKPDTDLSDTFRAWDMHMQEYINVNGWLTTWEENTEDKALILKVKEAVDQGHKVKAGSDAYNVIKDRLGQYLIVCELNDYTTGLHGREGTQYENRANANDFYIRNDDHTETPIK